MAGLTRKAALATLEEGWRETDALLARLTDEQMELPKTIGGGDWSAKDLLGHIAMWEELAVEVRDSLRTGAKPRAAEIIEAKSIDASNAEDEARTAATPLAQVRARADAAHESLVESIQGLTTTEWNAPLTYPGAGKGSLGDLMGGVTGAPKRRFGHAFAHLDDLRAYVESVSRR